MQSSAAEISAPQIDILAADVGTRIREARQARGLSLAQLGGEDLSRSFLSLVERGRSRISLRALSIVAHRLQLPISYFLEGTAEAGELAAELLLNEAEIAQDRGKPEESLSLLDQLPSQLSDEFLRRAFWLRGRALGRLGRSEEAAAALHEGLPLARESDDAHFRAHYQAVLGTALYNAGSFDEALPYLRSALEEALAGPEDPILIGRALVVIGHIHYVHNRFDLAMEHYHRATEHFGAVRDFVSQGSIYAGMSQVYRQMGDLGNAVKYSRLSVGVYRAANRLWEMTGELINVAVAYEEMGKLGEALATGDQALALAEQVQVQGLEALAHGVLASIYLKRGEIEQAQEEAERARGLAPENERTPAHATSLRTLAEIAELSGDHERADELFERALHNLRTSSQTAMYTSTALAYSLALRKRGDFERALEYAIEAAKPQAASR